MKLKSTIFLLIAFIFASVLYANSKILQQVLGEMKEVQNVFVANAKREIFFKYPEGASGTITFADPTSGEKTKQYEEHLIPVVPLKLAHKTMWIEMKHEDKAYNSGPIPVKNLTMYDLSKPESFLFFWTKCQGETEETGELCCRTTGKPNPATTISLETLGVLDKAMEKFQGQGLEFKILH